MRNKNEVFEYLIDQLRQQVNSNPYKQQCEDLAHEVQSLKNQLRDMSEQIKELQSELQHQIDPAAGVYRWSTAHFDEKGKVFKVERGVKTEQSGCRKEDTQGREHDWLRSKHKSGFVCFKCGARKECEHDWYFFYRGAMCKKCGLKK